MKSLLPLVLFPLLLVAQAPTPRFPRVSAFLEPDGLHYQLTSGTYAWEGQRLFFDLLVAGARMGAIQDPSSEGAAEVLADLPSLLGMNQIVASGASTVALPADGFRTRWALEHQAGAEGLLWKLGGEPFDPVAELRKLPPTAALALRYSVNAPFLRQEFSRLLLHYGVDRAALERFQADMADKGLPLDDLLAGLREGMTVAVCMNPEFTWTLPAPLPGGLRTPEMGLVIALGDPRGTLFAHIVGQFAAKQVPLLSMEVEGVTVRSLPIPAPVPTAVALQFASVDGRLLFATSPLLMQQLLQRRDGRADKAPLAARLGPNPLKSAQFLWVCDEQLPGLLMGLAAQALETLPPDQREVAAGAAALYQGLFKLMSSSAVLGHADDFVRLELLHPLPLPTQNGGASLAAAPAATSLLAAIAIPGLAKARETALRNACVNNLRKIGSAKDQWAIEWGKAGGDIPTEADLAPYLNGMPVCPQGGTYRIGGVGEDPECSVDGHSL